MIDSPYIVQPGKKITLSRMSTDDTGPFKDKADGVSADDKNVEKLIALQEVLYAEARHAVLIVFQAMDAGGKDGAIDHVFSGVNPQGCQVTSFKIPSEEEQAHDYLWRIHGAVPRKGMIGIFNRSHYESLLVERVKGLVPKDVWKRRYEHINQFEKLLADEGMVILKFFLHISKEEQKKRFQDRLADKTKKWKFNPNDLKDRAIWDQYMDAYEDVLNKCSTDHAPWTVVPSDRKWFRNWVISDIIVRTLQKLDMKFPPAVAGLDQIKVV